MDEHKAPLRREDLADNPFEQFAAWFEQAQEEVPLAEAMVLATASADGAPAARFVLLKESGPRVLSSTPTTAVPRPPISTRTPAPRWPSGGGSSAGR